MLILQYTYLQNVQSYHSCINHHPLICSFKHRVWFDDSPIILDSFDAPILILICAHFESSWPLAYLGKSIPVPARPFQSYFKHCSCRRGPQQGNSRVYTICLDNLSFPIELAPVPTWLVLHVADEEQGGKSWNLSGRAASAALQIKGRLIRTTHLSGVCLSNVIWSIRRLCHWARLDPQQEPGASAEAKKQPGRAFPIFVCKRNLERIKRDPALGAGCITADCRGLSVRYHPLIHRKMLKLNLHFPMNFHRIELLEDSSGLVPWLLSCELQCVPCGQGACLRFYCCRSRERALPANRIECSARLVLRPASPCPCCPLVLHQWRSMSPRRVVLYTFVLESGDWRVTSIRDPGSGSLANSQECAVASEAPAPLVWPNGGTAAWSKQAITASFSRSPEPNAHATTTRGRGAPWPPPPRLVTHLLNAPRSSTKRTGMFEVWKRPGRHCSTSLARQRSQHHAMEIGRPIFVSWPGNLFLGPNQTAPQYPHLPAGAPATGELTEGDEHCWLH